MANNGEKPISETGFMRKFSIRRSEINIKQLSEKLKEDTPREVDISYFEPDNQAKKVFTCKLENKTAVLFFYKLFIESKSIEQTAKEVQALYGLSRKDGRGVLEDIKAFHKRFEYLEYNLTDIPDYT